MGFKSLHTAFFGEAITTILIRIFGSTQVTDTSVVVTGQSF